MMVPNICRSSNLNNLVTIQEAYELSNCNSFNNFYVAVQTGFNISASSINSLTQW